MAWLELDFISGTFRQSFLGQDVINKMYWKLIQRIDPVPIGDALDFLSTTIITGMSAMQSDDLQHFAQSYENVTNGLDIHTTNIVVDGARATGDNLNSFTALGLTRGVSTKVTRPGGIRVGGLKEVDIVGNAMITSMAILLSQFGDLISSDIVYIGAGSSTLTFSPYIIGRTPTGAIDLSRVNSTQTWTNGRVTSQVSRRA